MLSYEWAWEPEATLCGIQRCSKAQVASIFQDTRLLFLGDSHVRYLHNWLAKTLGGEASTVAANLSQSSEVFICLQHAVLLQVMSCRSGLALSHPRTSTKQLLASISP